MLKVARSTLVLFGLLTIITGVIYPLFVTVIAQVIFPHQANGSLIVVEDRVVGSELIGQYFLEPKYFWSRPSLTGGRPYNAAASAGSNLAPSNPVLMADVSKRVQLLTSQEPHSLKSIPIDLITASASGLDAHISVDAARYQIGRVAKARHLDEKMIASLIDRSIEAPQLGFLGEPRLNVLRINLALDELQ